MCYVIGILAQGGIQYIRAVALQFFLRWSFGSGLLFHAVKIAYSLPCFQFAFQLVLSGHGLDVSHVFYFTLT